MPIKTDELVSKLNSAELKYQEIYQQYIYLYGALAILVEQEGGLVEISTELLESYDLRTPMTITRDDEKSTYIIEVVPE